MPKQAPLETPAKSESKPTIETLQTIIERQTAAIEKLIEDNRKIKRRLFFIALGSNIRFILFLIPLVLMLIYVVPFLRENWESMQALLSITQPGGNGGGGSLFDQLSKEGINISTLLQELQRTQTPQQ